MNPPGDSPAPGIAVVGGPRDLRASRYRMASEHPQDQWARATPQHWRIAGSRSVSFDHRVSAVSDRRAPERSLTFAHGPGVVLPSPAPKEPQFDAARPGFNLALKRLG